MPDKLKPRIDSRTYRYPWHGGAHAFRAVLRNASGTDLGENIPFCLACFLGNLVEEITEGMGQDKFLASAHVPVKARMPGDRFIGDYTLHVEFECDIRCRAASERDEQDDWEPRTAYADGVLKLTKLMGPVNYRSDDWSGMTLCFAPMGHPVTYQDQAGGA